MRTVWAGILAVGIIGGLWACGSDSDDGPTVAPIDTNVDAGDGGAPSVPPPSNDSGTDAADAAPDAASETLLAPLIDVLQHGTTPGRLELGWVNNQPDCDAVVGERKDALDPYTQIFSVSGTTTTYTDDVSAKPNAGTTSFTYRVRCMKGGAYSPYSNEQSLTGT